MHVAHRTRSRLDLIEREKVEREKAEEKNNGGKIPVGDSRKLRECERFLPTCGPRSRRRVSSSVSCNVEEQQSLDENGGAMVGDEGGDGVGFGGSNNPGFERIGTGVFGSERSDNVGSMEVGSTDDAENDVVFLGEEEEGGTVDFDEVIDLFSESGFETESVTVDDNDVVNSFGPQLGEGRGSVYPGKEGGPESFLSRGTASFVFEGMENCTLTGTTESPVACVNISDERVVSSNVISDESYTLEILTDEGNSESSSSDVPDMDQYSEDCCSMELRQSCNLDQDGEKVEGLEASQPRKGRREKIIEDGLKRRKADGLDILVREGSPSMNCNMDDLLYLTQKEKSAVRRTRSRFNLKKARKMSKFGTLVQPICIDDDDLELSSVDGDDGEMKSSSEHGDSDDDETDARMGAWKRKLNNDVVDEYSDDNVITEKEDIGAKKIKSSKRKCGSYNAKNDKNVGKYLCIHGDKNSILQKKINRRKSESYGVDHSDSHSNGYKTSVHETKCIRRRSGPCYAINTDVRDEIQNDYDTSCCEGMNSFNGRKACQHEMDNIAFVGKRRKKLKQGKRKRKKSTFCLKNYDVFKILEDSIYNELPVSPENLSIGDAGGSPPVTGPSIPCKFTFGIEESVLLDKSEVEKELDELWREMEFALGCTEVNYDHAAEVGIDSIHSSGVDRATICNRGHHELLIDEQIGYICKFCAYVGVEMKHILPPFAKDPRVRSQWKDVCRADQSVIDDIWNENPYVDNFFASDCHDRAKGTVWDIIPGVKHGMYPHQREGFEFLWRNIAGGIYLNELKKPTNSAGGNGCIISHAPGTGKTRLAIAFLQAYMKLHPTCRPMIIAPSSMLITWEEEFEKWKFDVPFHNLRKSELPGKKTELAAVTVLRQAGCHNRIAVRVLKLHSWKKERSVLGISYRLFAKLAGQSSEREMARKILLEVPDLLVLDEGHTPRNTQTIIWKAVSEIRTKRRIILSGTPFQNNFEELYNTLCLARPKFTDKLLSVRHLRPRYEKRGCKGNDDARRKWISLTNSIGKVTDDEEKAKLLKEIRGMINPFVHVYNGDILQESLPGLRDVVVVLKPTQLQKELIENMQKRRRSGHEGSEEYLAMFGYEHRESLASVHPSLLHLCKEMRKLEKPRAKPEAGVKTAFVVELVRFCSFMNEKVLVFSQFIDPLNFLTKQLMSHFLWTEGKQVMQMDGGIDLKQRQASIHAFNDPSNELRVLLASTKAFTEGINLVGGSRVVLLDVVWNPSVERQAISRAYRLGQKKIVYIYHLLISGTRDEEQFCRQAEKDALSDLVFFHSGKTPLQQNTVSEDKIMEEMLQHEKLKHMFEKVYQRKSF